MAKAGAKETRNASDFAGEKLLEIGRGLSIARVRVNSLREQDINARYMPPDMFKQLVANVESRGVLESLPYCALMDGRVEIVSGHHRVRAARAAGLDEILVLLDESGLTRSQVAAKQLAHNSLSGFDDPDLLKQIAAKIDDVDDLIEAYVPPEIAEQSLEELEVLLSPRIDFDWKTITMVFLPHQLEEFEQLIDHMDDTQDLVAVSPLDIFDEFAEALEKYSRFRDIRSVGTTVALMTRLCLEELDAAGFEQEDEEGNVSPWTPLSGVIGAGMIPVESAEIIKQALEKMEHEGHVGKKNRWQALEYWAADYLAGE